MGGAHQQYGKAQGNIYLTLMQVYMNPRKTTKNIEKRITNLVTSSSTGNLKSAWSSVRGKGKGLGKKIVEIESAEDSRMKASSGESGRSDYDTDDVIEERSSTVMLDEVLDVLSQRWDRLHGAKTVRLLPKETKLQVRLYLYYNLHPSFLFYCQKWLKTSIFYVKKIPFLIFYIV